MLPRALPAPALLLCALAPLLCGAAQAEENPFVEVPGAEFRSALPAGKAEVVPIRTFLLQRHPVTNGEFLAFVTGHPEWRRGTAPAALTDAGYLTDWSGPLDPGPRATASQPVTQVSWFAAEAYCEAQHA